MNEATINNNAVDTQTAMNTNDAEQQLAKIAKGALKLAKPIMAAGREITELRWDFRDLTGWEYANALDCDNAGVNVFRITNKQAFSLFAAAAAKATTIKNDGGVDMHPLDARDIKERMGIDDTIKAVQVATVFFRNFCPGGKQAYFGRITGAAMATHTPIPAFMDMPIMRFYEFNNAVCEMLRSRAAQK